MGVVVRIGTGLRVHDPIGCTRGQDGGARGLQMAEQVTTAMAVACAAAVADTFVHASMVDTQQPLVVGVLGLEDSLTIEIHGEPIHSVRHEEAEQIGQQHRNVNEVEESVGDEHVERLRPRRARQKLAELRSRKVNDDVHTGLAENVQRLAVVDGSESPRIRPG